MMPDLISAMYRMEMLFHVINKSAENSSVPFNLDLNFVVFDDTQKQLFILYSDVYNFSIEISSTYTCLRGHF